MTSRRTARLCCLLGGSLWVVRWMLAPSAAAADVMRYAGLALLAVGLVIAGAGLVKRGTWWLRAVAGVGAAVLLWSVVEMFRPSGDALAVDGVTGMAAITAGLAAAVIGRGRTFRRVAGTHAR